MAERSEAKKREAELCVKKLGEFKSNNKMAIFPEGLSINAGDFSL